MNLKNAFVGMKVRVKESTPNTKNLKVDFGRFAGRIGKISDIDCADRRGLTIEVIMDDGTELCLGGVPWFSHKDLRIVKGDRDEA